MNKNIFKIAAFVLVAGVTVLTGCKKDDEETKVAPTITLSPGDVTYTKNIGEAVTVLVTFAATEEFSTIKVKTTKNGTTTTETIANYDSKTSHKYTFNYTLAAADFPTATSEVVVVFEVTDKESASTSKTITIKKTGTTATFTGLTWTGKIMGSSTSSYGSYFGATTGTVYTSSQVAANVANIDIIFDNIAGAKALSIYSPKVVNNAYRASKFGTSTLDFATVTDEQIAAISVTADRVAVVSGGIYAFETADSKKGLVKVTALGTNQVTIDVKFKN